MVGICEPHDLNYLSLTGTDIMNFKIEQRKREYVNTDLQRRCYNGHLYKGEWRWSEWDAIQWDVPEEEVEECLAYWRDLHAYSRSVGSKQVCEFRAIEDH